MVRRLRASVDAGVRSLHPGYFALVMATGIVSNAFYYLGQHGLATFLLVVNLIAFPVLLAATLARALLRPSPLWADLLDPGQVFAFFTIVAGADVLGLQLALRGDGGVAAGLWVAALVVWILLSYFSFSLLAFANADAGAGVVNGGWLIAIVGTESLALLGVRIAHELGSLQHAAFVMAYTLWGVGIVLYGIFITLFSYRVFFLPLDAVDMTPLFWVIMGAAAISANAGSAMILTPSGLPFLSAMPLLVIFGVWRHVVRRHPIIYDPLYWSVVFPLGMYALATYRLGLAADFRPLEAIPRVMVWVAFASWLAAMAGVVASARRALRTPAPVPAGAAGSGRGPRPPDRGAGTGLTQG
jgi:tellurite resistance protein TehA-like permease